MPVDLSIIPPVVKRKKPPLLKRWLFFLFIMTVCSGLLVAWLWPTNKENQIMFFWIYVVGVPVLSWLIFFSLRWLIYLVSISLSDGWNHEREKDIADEIQRGQRYLALKGFCVRLPHIVTSGGLTEQFMLSQGVVLPAVVNELTQSVDYKAYFSDKGQPVTCRIIKQIQFLLIDEEIQKELLQINNSAVVKVIIQVDSDSILTEDAVKAIDECVGPQVPPQAQIIFSSQFGLTDIDNWLDNEQAIGTLLILSVKIHTEIKNGEGEAAVALILHSSPENLYLENCIAHIHRPEKSSPEITSDTIGNALLWGKTTIEEINLLWLAGINSEEATEILFSGCIVDTQSNLLTDNFININNRSGDIGLVTPWLAIILAAGADSNSYSSSHLVVSKCRQDTSLWCLVVRPVNS